MPTLQREISPLKHLKIYIGQEYKSFTSKALDWSDVRISIVYSMTSMVGLAGFSCLNRMPRNRAVQAKKLERTTHLISHGILIEGHFDVAHLL